MKVYKKPVGSSRCGRFKLAFLSKLDAIELFTRYFPPLITCFYIKCLPTTLLPAQLVAQSRGASCTLYHIWLCYAFLSLLPFHGARPFPQVLKCLIEFSSPRSNTQCSFGPPKARFASKSSSSNSNHPRSTSSSSSTTLSSTVTSAEPNTYSINRYIVDPINGNSAYTYSTAVESVQAHVSRMSQLLNDFNATFQERTNE
jgi:hypothetical protein